MKDQIQLEDLLTDEAFIRWVRNPTYESGRYWESWMTAHPECDEIVQRAREMVLLMEYQMPAPEAHEKQEVLERIIGAQAGRRRKNHAGMGRLPRIQPGWKPGILPGLRPGILYRVAASILVVFSLYGIFRYYQGAGQRNQTAGDPVVTVKETPKGAKMQTALPDGTRVWLNSGSRLSYTSGYGKADRVVTLAGEAFFDVVKNPQKPFYVMAGGTAVRALGTSFNVRVRLEARQDARQDAQKDAAVVEVALVSGSVEVRKQHAGDQRVILNPGEKAISDTGSGLIQKASFLPDKELGWKNGLIYFGNSGFEEIKTTLENWYGVTIKVSDPEKFNWNYSGKFQDQSLELVLERLSFIENFEFEINGNEVKLYNLK